MAEKKSFSYMARPINLIPKSRHELTGADVRAGTAASSWI
jgi:hypothetical protein